MPLLLLRAQQVITPDETIRPATILISGAVIEAVGAALSAPAGAEIIDLPGLTLAPGFIDVHVHGGGGFSLTTPDPEEISAYSAWAPRHGVTGFLAGIVARTPAEAVP
jgi:N-acetylglucosamine-6-phosphate deacetylase